MGNRIGALVFAVVGMAMAVSAQTTPDFSGTWLEDRDRLTNLLTGKPVETSQASGGSLALPPGKTVVTQTADLLTIEVTFERKGSQAEVSNRYIYKLDGSKSVNHNGAQTQTTTSRWDGNRLVTEGSIFQVTSQGEASWIIREVIYLTKGELMLERTWSQDGKVTTSNRRVYRRAGA